MKCFNCSNEFDSHKGGDEHIISYSLGGKLHSRNLICPECNSSKFSPLERELNEQLGWISRLLELNRKGRRKIKSIPMIDSDGRTRDLNSDFTPKHVIRIEQVDGTSKEYQYQTDEEYRKMLKAFEKVYPNHKKSERTEDLVRYPRNRDTDDTTISFVNNELYLKHMFKVGIEFYLYNNLPISEIQLAVENFKNNLVTGRVYEYLPNEPIYSPKEGELSHVLYLRVDSKLGLIYCWVSYFNLTSTVGFLNDNYKGSNNMEIVYGYDVIKEEVINLKPNDISLTINPEGVRNRKDNKMKKDSDVFEKRFERVWNILRAQLEKNGRIKSITSTEK